MPPWEVVTLLSVGSVFLSPALIVAIVLRHRERMTALKQRIDGAPAVVAELQNLRSELTQLRETTTRYDMSFDAALQRVEERVESVEQSNAANRYPAYGGVNAGTVAEEQILRQR